MNEKKDCKIIQDLLPNYIEELTNEETNNFIEKHLEECDECKQILENMQKDLKLNIDNKDKRTIKYFKKYRNRLRLLKVILLVIIVIFIRNITRKMIILSDMYNKANTYVNSDNYHSISYSYYKDKIFITENWGLGDKRKAVITAMTLEGTTITSIYGNKIGTDEWGNERYNTNMYTVTENNKTAKLDINMGINSVPHSMLDILRDDFYRLFLSSIHSSIKSVTLNGEKYYYIQSSDYFVNGMYISKDTGLTMRILSQEVQNSEGVLERLPAEEYVYEFNTVTEKDFIEPDINEYEIEQ